ncbi:MAG: stage II sporulation protein M [Chitinophagales bacterium]|nr:stage II sporulation protein M [Chitinophagales bacterium]
MRETKFIEQNKKKWEEFEEEFNQNQRDSNKLSKLFIQITDDLSYSRTFYGSRSVRYYLNILAQRVFGTIYKRPKRKRGVIADFLLEEMPAVIYASRKEFMVAGIFFLISILIGFVSSAYDSDFVSQIMSEEYVQMTKDNIAKGDPMAVYKQSEDAQQNMMLYITINNIIVALITFISGILAGLGTLYNLLTNGIMIGAFQHLFYEYGLMKEFFLAVFLHGMIEIPSIVIAGAAGLTLARGIIFPGTYSRLQALQVSAAKGIKIFVTTIPLFIIAGTIEGFLTRYTEIHDGIRLFFILLCATLLITYYIWLPISKRNKGTLRTFTKEKVIASDFIPNDINSIRNLSTVFYDTFYLYRRVVVNILKIFIPFGVVYTLVAIFTQRNFLAERFIQEENILQNLSVNFSYERLSPFIPLNFILFFLIIAYCVYIFFKYIPNTYFEESPNIWTFYAKYPSIILSISITDAIIHLYLSFGEKGFWYLVFLSPAFLFFMPIFSRIGTKGYTAFFQNWLLGIKYGFKRFIHSYISFLMMLFMVICINFALSFFIKRVLQDKILLNLPEQYLNVEMISYTIYFMSTVINIACTLPIIIFSQGFIFFSNKEINEANDLSEKLSKIGAVKKKYA